MAEFSHCAATVPLVPGPGKSTAPRTGRGDRLVNFLGIAIGAGVLLLQLFALWRHPLVPSQNGPWFLSAGFVFLHCDDPSYRFAEFFQRNWHPIPHMLHDALVVCLQTVVSLHVAEKLALSVYVLALPLSVFFLLRTVAPRGAMVAALALPMTFNYPFLRGYHDFTLSLPLAFATVAYWMRVRSQLSPRRIVVLNLLMAATYLAHLFSFLAVVVCLLLHEVTASGRLTGALRVLSAATAGLVLTSHYVWLNRASTWLTTSDTEWLPFHWTLQRLHDRFFFSTDLLAAGIAAAPFVLAMAVILWGTFRGLVRSDRRPCGLRALAVLTVAVTIASWCAPEKLLGWHKVVARFAPFVAVAVLCCAARVIHLTGRYRLGYLLAGIAAVSAILSTARIDRDLGRMARLVSEYARACEALPRNSTCAFLMLENPSFGLIRPLTRAYEYATIRRGVIHGQALARLNTLAMVWYRKYPVESYLPSVSLQDLADPDTLIASTPYEVIVTYGRAHDVDSLVARGDNLKAVDVSEKMRILILSRN